ncbi:MAG: hypothetical protein UV38_C0001G0003 [candidate division TM6 bacterium GW2011_GWE2_42_60]|nr:MAG: hypothetical protein UV38_C0001G0003 [candidate division TM6 bacterium GW2011_GWE2_42_60]HBY05802.1 hypothetical protein [Candidatus Dependentiae bacterium]
MNRKDLQELRIHCGYPAITLVMPCNKEKIRATLQTILDDVREANLPKTILEKSVALLDQLGCPLDEKTTKIALFIDAHRARLFTVPACVADIATHDTSFRLDAITSALNYQLRYWVIDCSNNAPHLIEGVEEQLTQLHNTCAIFDTKNCPTALTKNKNECLNTCFASYMEQDPLPIILVGSKKETAYNSSFILYEPRIVARVESLEDVWPTIQRWHAAEIEKLLHKIRHQEPPHDFISRFDEIVTAARQGLVIMLAVEKGYMRAGCEHPVTRAVVLNASCPTGFVSISAVDQLLEAVRAKGGDVLLVPDGSLKEHHRMIAFVTMR